MCVCGAQMLDPHIATHINRNQMPHKYINKTDLLDNDVHFEEQGKKAVKSKPDFIHALLIETESVGRCDDFLSILRLSSIFKMF